MATNTAIRSTRSRSCPGLYNIGHGVRWRSAGAVARFEHSLLLRTRQVSGVRRAQDLPLPDRLEDLSADDPEMGDRAARWNRSLCHRLVCHFPEWEEPRVAYEHPGADRRYCTRPAGRKGGRRANHDFPWTHDDMDQQA